MKKLTLVILIAFIAFSLTASAIYILNDYHDIEEDRQHPKKKDRPLASKAISKLQAIIIMSVLFIFGFTLMFFLPFAVFFAVFFLLRNNREITAKYLPLVVIGI